MKKILIRNVLLLITTLTSLSAYACYYDKEDAESYCELAYNGVWRFYTDEYGVEWGACSLITCHDDICTTFDYHRFHKSAYLVCPEISPPGLTPPSNPPNSCPPSTTGSIISIDSQVVAEEIRLTGVPFSIVYSSDKVRGRKTWYQALIPITHDYWTNHPTIVSQSLEVIVTGQTYADTFSPAAGTNFLYTWDGKDGLGNPVSGPYEATIKVTENYSPSQPYPHAVQSKVVLGSRLAEGIGFGGWNFSVNHQYDQLRKVLYLGDGTSYPTPYSLRSNGHYWVPSQNRAEVYVFDSNFKHIQTLHGLTGSLKYEFTYNSNKLTKVEDAYGNETTIQYSSSSPISITSPYGQVTTLGTDSNGYINSVTNPAFEEFEMTYNSEGLLLTFEKPSGITSTMTYDAAGRLLTDASSAGSSATLVSTFSQSGLNVTQTTSEGIVTSYSLTPSTTGIRTVTTFPDSSTSTIVEVYGDKTLSSTMSSGYRERISTSQVDPRFGGDFKIIDQYLIQDGGVGLIKQYNETVTLSSPTDPFSITNLLTTWTQNSKTFQNSFTGSTKTQVATSPEGRIVTTIYDANENPTSVQEASYTPITYDYDSKGRIEEVAQGPSRTTTLTYHSANGLLASITNPLIQTESFTYDSAARLSTHTLPDARVISYTYDSNGNIATVTPPGKSAHTFNYNGFDLIDSYIPPTLFPPSTVSSTYYYNDDKRLIQITRPDSQIIQYDYNSITGFLDSIILPSSMRYFYYTNGFISGSFSEDLFQRTIGRAGQLVTSESMFAFYAPLSYSITYSYNDDILLSSEELTMASAVSVGFTYDDDGLLISAGPQTIDRTASSGKISLINLDDITEAYTYSSNYGELVSLEAKYDTNYTYRESMTRDDLGRIDTRTEIYGTGTADLYTYTYDSTGRLSTVTLNGNPHSSYLFDTNSNRISETRGGITTSATYDAHDRLLTYGDKSFTYNANGEVATQVLYGETTTFTYDVLGNLKSHSRPSKIITYQVDAHNRRMSKKVDSIMENYFVWNNKNQLIAITDGSGIIQSRFVYGSKSHVPDYLIKGSTKYKIITDHLGSPVVVVHSTNGTIAQQVTYDEFGNILTDTSPGYTPFGFAGCLYDQDTKLCRFGARDYDASIGRWLSKDPILFDGGDTNLYGYVMQDPINWIDSDGLSPNRPIMNPADDVLTKPGGSFGGGFGRGGQKLVPIPGTSAAHTSFKYGPNGKISSYSTWTPNPLNPTGFDLQKRFDGSGRHGSIQGPHIHEPGGVRPANACEFPGGN